MSTNKVSIKTIKENDFTVWSDKNSDVIEKSNRDKLVEDLAVWFGTKKKPKGSKQPKGPWVNICRKKEGGGHPPCGRDNTDKGAYPKCRAAGVAGKMTDAQKKAACSQKRRAEKKDNQTGKGQKPVYTSYKPKKKTKKESLLSSKEFITEKFKIEPSEYKKLYEDNNFLLVIPFTHDASCKYGAGTKWCTTGRDDKGSEWFNKHNNVGSLGYLIIKNKELSDKLESSKYGLFINKPDTNYLGGRFAAPLGIIVYDDKNNPIHTKVLSNKFDKENLYGKLSTILNLFMDYSNNKFKTVDTDYNIVK